MLLLFADLFPTSLSEIFKVSNKLERKWKDTFVVQFNGLFRHLRRETKECHKTPQGGLCFGRDTNRYHFSQTAWSKALSIYI
jgi:hypothetical protein